MISEGFYQNNFVNYFVVIHGEFQKNTVEKLASKFNLNEDYNVMLFRYPFGKKPKIIRSNIYNKYFAIPHFQSDYKFLKWFNFFIYIFFFSIVHLLIFKRRKNLVIGNLLYNGNKFICNQFYWNDIFILDEGASTLPLFEKRNNNLKRNKERILDKILRTYEPNKKLNFFTKYNIPENNFDKIYRYQSFSLDGIKNKIKSNSHSNRLLFVGSPIVEKKFIAQNTFEELLQIISSTNKNFEIHYAPHPRESLILEIISSYPNIHIIKIDQTIEEFIQDNYYNYKVISSCISTGFINIYQGFEDYFEYQTYVFDMNLINYKNRQSMQSFYDAIKKDKDYLDLSNDFILINE